MFVFNKIIVFLAHLYVFQYYFITLVNIANVINNWVENNNNNVDTFC